MRDNIFHEKIEEISDFKFNQEVADVFDDMVKRSVPNYEEVHKIILDLCRRAYQSGHIYDFGCSTATTLQSIGEYFRSNQLEMPLMTGIDNSSPMVKKAKNKVKSHGLTQNIHIEHADILTYEPHEEAGMIIMNYTMQFLPLESRQELLEKIYRSLKPGGIFVLSEKVICHDESIDDLIVELYYDFKRRNGYSEMEISQKREALEDVMRPIKPAEQIQMLSKAGFDKTEMIFRWYNFSCYLGIK